LLSEFIYLIITYNSFNRKFSNLQALSFLKNHTALSNWKATKRIARYTIICPKLDGHDAPGTADSTLQLFLSV